MIKFSESAIKLLDIPQVFISKLLSKNDDKPLNTADRNRVELKVQELAKKLEINKPIELIECDVAGSAQTIFNLLSGRIKIAINLDPVDPLPDSMLEFLLAHELCHIKAFDADKLING